jgi:hypothetical protein
MFNSLHHKNLSRLAVAGTATLVSPATCGRGSIQHLISNSLMNQLTNLITPLQLSRDLYKSTIFLQNKANLKHLFESITAYEISGSVNFMLFFRQKNKAKQSQFKPNFSPILALFFPKLALIRNKIVVLEHILKGWCADSRVEKACFGRPMQCTQKPSKTAATKPNQRQSAINLFCKFCCKTILLKYNLIFVYFLERKVNGEAIFRFDRRMGIQGVPSLCPQNA